MNIKLLPNFFITDDGKFDMDKALLFSGQIAGVCYDKDGFEHLKNENKDKTLKRVENTLINGHHSVYDHITVNLNLIGIPKILAMVLNNEHQYTTSEKSGRYTNVTYKNDVLSDREVELYNKWFLKFKKIIRDEYPEFSDFKVKTLSQENARYLITVFMPTEMIYSTSLRQLNYIVSFMDKYIDYNSDDYLKNKLSSYMSEFISLLDGLNLLDDRLRKNDKQRSLLLFNDNIDLLQDSYSHIYSTNYELSFAAFAQAQRHRTIDYQIKRLSEKKFFVPPILLKNNMDHREWLDDISSLADIVPQGEMILVNETGTYDNFILKTKERLCTSAQLEIMKSTKDILLKYKRELEKNNNPLKDDIKKYVKGARCTFGYCCTQRCNFNSGITLEREI